MNQWVQILLDAEDKWATFATAHSLAAREIGTLSYSCERDKYKAQYIFENYGYEYFLKFAERCPHIQDLLKEIVPCYQDGQCMVFCKFYENGGCINATE